MAELLRNNKNIKILTDSGFEPFDGLSIENEQQTITIAFEDSTDLQCTPDHKIYTTNSTSTEAKNLRPGDFVKCDGGYKVVQDIDMSDVVIVYDIVNAGKNKRFYANKTLVSNCEFITADETLIAALKLLELEGEGPLYKTGEVRWYDYPANYDTFIVTLDPSLGTGGDPAGLQVYGLPGMVQVAEWRHNQTPIRKQILLMRRVLEYLEDENLEAEIYWSVENNTLGEAALVVIEELGEDEFPGVFVTEKKKKGRQRAVRKGFTTTGKSKLLACMRFKHLIENDAITLRSKPLIHEIKNFIAHSTSYAAKQGETDDLVMSSLLAIRVLETVSDYDDDAYDTLMDSADDDDDMDPMPMIFV